MKRKWSICPACDGEGTCVNPNIDDNGITAEEFYDDPDFADDYFSGVFDQQCAACNGTGKVTDERLDQLAENSAERRMRAMEDGDWDSYFGAGDYRHG